MSGVSGMLIGVLIMSALLGGLLGVAACVLVAQRRARSVARAYLRSDETSRSGDSRVLELSARLSSESERLAAKLSSSQAAEREALSRIKSLQASSQAQARQIVALMEEQRAAEERQIRLQQAFRHQQQESALAARERGLTSPAIGSSPTVDARDVDRAAGDTVPVDEANVPVLNRRVTPAASTASALMRSRLASGQFARDTNALERSGGVQSMPIEEGDLPALSEAELPDDVDGLELDVIENADKSG